MLERSEELLDACNDGDLLFPSRSYVAATGFDATGPIEGGGSHRVSLVALFA